MKRRVHPASMHWMHKPNLSIVSGDKLIIETDPFTSLNALSYGSHEAAGKLLDPMNVFDLSLRVDYSFNAPADECGILVRKDSRHWLKCCVECRDGNVTDLACTVYSSGYGDRSVREIGDVIRYMYFRVTFWSGNLRIRYSFNGDRYSDLRWLHFVPEGISVTPGIYACSPSDSWFDCTFSEMDLNDEII